MPTEPPPLPQESRKRILPAFLLCFVLCAHRIYAGRYISGIVQIGLAAATFFWMEIACKDLIAIIHTSPLDIDTINRISDWQEKNGIPFMPMLAMLAVGVWVAIDAARLIAGKFTDGQGNRITRWL